MDFSGKNIGVPVRYGFLVGMMAIPFIGGNTCCSFCNFTHTQNIISAITGDTLGISYWASFSIFSFVLWFVVLGLFTKGGRGWCNFLCPAGALMGLAHAIGTKLRLGRSMNISRDLCRNCRTCSSVCPAWAISKQEEASKINYHACTACMDCSEVCPHNAISYGRTPAVPKLKLKDASYDPST
jgi:formate hydrogenlyase subunit 6/NADH:ubiquinone oxidoreductase subunit I